MDSNLNSVYWCGLALKKKKEKNKSPPTFVFVGIELLACSVELNKWTLWTTLLSQYTRTLIFSALDIFVTSFKAALGH